MRIGFVTGEYPPMEGGVGAYTHELALALQTLGHESFVLTDKRVPSGEANGVQVSGKISGWNRASLGTLKQWARESRLDVISLQYETQAFQMAQAIQILPLLLRPFPTVTMFHDLLPPYLFPKAGPLRQQSVKLLARLSHGSIATNREDEQQLRQWGIPHICNIPIGSNIAVMLPPDYDRIAWRTRLNIPADAVLVGYFGFMNATKGVDTLLKAAEQAIRDGLNVHVLLIGGRIGTSDGTNVRQADSIDQLIADLNLADRVHWTGFVDGPLVSANLTACDMIALPFRDGITLRRGSFMAAIAHGCPIITTQPQSELPEVVDHKNMLLVPPDDPTRLAAAIGELTRDPDLRVRLGRGAKELSTLFTWDKIAAQTIAFYNQLGIRG
jgi:glycosyltransferase involved in cell wall biosynthesis